MKVSVLLLLSTLVVTSASHAEVPLSWRLHFGIGPGGGHRNEMTYGTLAGFGAGDLLWRRSPSRSLVFSFEAANAPHETKLSFDPFESPHYRLGDVHHEDVLIGMEHSRAGPGFAVYLHGGVGLGRLTTEIVPRRGAHSTYGMGLGGGIGWRVVSPMRQLGFGFGLRTNTVIAPHARAGVLAVTLGIAFRPR